MVAHSEDETVLATDQVAVYILKSQLRAQECLTEAAYEEMVKARDAAIAGLMDREKIHFKLAIGILDRILNPVKGDEEDPA